MSTVYDKVLDSVAKEIQAETFFEDPKEGTKAVIRQMTNLQLLYHISKAVEERLHEQA